MKKGAKVWCFIVILTVVGLMFSGLIDTTSATTEKTTVSVTDSSPWFTKGTNSGSGPWYPHLYEDHDYISTYVGGMSWLGGSPSEPDCWAKFKPYLSQPGEYEVYAYFFAWKDTSTIVPFTVKYDGGSTPIKVNQSSSIPAWKEEKLGTWYFEAGQDTYVEVTDATGEPYYHGCKGLTIGAIKFVKKETVPTPIITGIDPSQPTASPTWQWITIKGTDFVSDSTVTLRIGSSTYPIPADRTEFKSSTQIRVRAGLTDPGTWTAQVTNPGNRISNLFSFTVKQDIPSPVHDMTVTDVQTSPDSPNVGQSTTIHVTVKNEGRQQENYVPVKAYVDGYQVGSAQYVTLLDGKSTTKSFTWTPSSAKTYSVKGEVGVVSGETETSDNEKTISVSVQQQNQPPNTPTMLFQLKSDGVTLIPVGSETTENSVTFKGVVSDPDGDQVKLQVELRRLDEYGGQFDETQGGFKESGFLESGSEAVAYANDLIDADYHWRARAVDEHGNEGEWENFGNNFNSEIDFRVSWGVIKYAPTLKFDRNDERYFPCDIHGDDDNVINNHENYDASDLPKTTDDGKHVCYYYVKEYTEQSGQYPEHPDYYVYEYWYYYAFNEYSIIDYFNHEHDLESVFIWVDKKTGKPFHLALSCHLWFNEYEIHSVDELAVYVEKGGHGMSKDGKNNVPFEYQRTLHAGLIYPGDPDESIKYPFNSDGLGEVLKGNENFDFRPLDSLIHYEDRDLLKDEGSEYYNQFKSGCTKPGEYDLGGNKYDDDHSFILGEGKTPWYRCDNPEEEVSMIRGQTILSILTEKGIILTGKGIYLRWLHILLLFNSPELRIYDSHGNVTGLVGGEVKEEIPNSIYDEESETIIIFSPTDLNSYRYKIVGTDEETYVFRVTSVEGGEFTNFTATDIPISPNAIHQYTIDWAALSQGEKGVTVKMDSNGNGTFERTIITNNSFHPLIAEFTFSPENPLIGEKVTLDASTSFDLGGGEIKKYRWEFYNAANQDPFYVIEGHDKEIIRYSFTSEGIYRVRLTVTDDEGEYSYTESSITIKEPAFYVPDDYPSIQAAVDAASAGDTIIVRDGTYYENVDIDKSITLKSSSGNPEYTIVDAVDSYADVFSVTADHVNISGFTVTGAPDFYGIYLYNADYCDISDNICSHNAASGIYLSGSNSNSISNNTCFNNGMGGICLSSSTKNSIANNTCSNNGFAGIDLGCSNQNSISNNLCCNNKLGIFLDATNNNCIYLNNFINNDCNAYSCSSTNTWYSPLKESYSYNGESHTKYLGNYWNDYTGTDANKNGIGDSPYSIDDRGGDIDQDYYPLMTRSEHYTWSDFDESNKATCTNSIGMEFVLIPAGEFEMGSPSDEEGRWSNEGPVHHVTIENSFYMGKYEVTQKQWREIIGENPSWFEGDNLPVEQVSWVDVQEFIRKLNEKEGTDKYRLPSEAEWEYACRAGTITRYSFGDDDTNLGDYVWTSDWKTHPVGQKKPNSWELYDMHGSVWEWVQDSWHSSYSGAPVDGSAWENGEGAYRVRRGGGWNRYPARICRSADRGCAVPGCRGSDIGFRLLKEQ